MLAISTEKESFDLQPNSFEQAIKYAEYIAKSSMVPTNYKDKPADVLIAIQMGKELGLKPLQALQNIATINGRPCIWGDAMLAIVKVHPDYESIEEYIKDNTAYCVVKRKNEPVHTATFSIADAKQAGLVGKSGPWTQYPNRMLQMRARGFALRNTFPDALRGIISREEAEDYSTMRIVNSTEQKAENIKQLLKNNPSDSAPITNDAMPLVTEEENEKLFKELQDKILNAPTLIDLKAIGQRIKLQFKGTPAQVKKLQDQYSIRADELKPIKNDEQ